MAIIMWMLIPAVIVFMTASADGGHVFCYYSSFAQTRQGVGKFLPEKIDPFLCSHVIYAFVDITSDGTDLKPFNRNDQGSNGLYARTLALKKQNPDLKVLLAVGGWQIGSKPFIPMVSNEHKRKTWVKNVVKYLRQHSFDGFDVDWEFPATRGSPPEDKYRFTKMMKELYEAFAEDAQETGKDKLILTMATASGTYYIDQSYEPTKIIKYIDFMLLMTYNYHGQWEKTTGHHSGLYGHHGDPGAGEKSQLNQQWSIDYWLNVGISPNKLIVGIPTYGMSFTLADPSQHDVHSPAVGGGRMGDYTHETGILSYYEICLNQREKGWNKEWIKDQAAPYTFHHKQWAGYDDVKSVVLKSKNIVKRGLAGAFVWSVEMDDFNGVCDKGKYPLLSAINGVINSNGRKTPDSSRNFEFSDTKLESIVQPPVSKHSSDHGESSDDNDNNDNKNNNEVMNAKQNIRRRGRKLRRKQVQTNSASKSNPDSDKRLNLLKKSRSKTRLLLTAMPRPKTTASSLLRSSSSSPTATSLVMTTTDAPGSTTTRESLVIKWWSGTVYRKEPEKSRSKSTRRRGGVGQRKMKMRKTLKKHTKTNESHGAAKDTSSQRTNKHHRNSKSQTSNYNDKVHLKVVTQKAATTHWWRRHDSGKVADEITPNWRWMAGDNHVTSKPNKESTTSSSTHLNIESKMTSRRPKSPSYRRRNSVSSRRRSGQFSKKFDLDKKTKKIVVKTAAASADTINCQKLGAGTFPDPRSCSRFIICMPGSWLEHPPHVMYCPHGTMFDENLNICNYASRVRCPYWNNTSS